MVLYGIQSPGQGTSVQKEGVAKGMGTPLQEEPSRFLYLLMSTQKQAHTSCVLGQVRDGSH